MPSILALIFLALLLWNVGRYYIHTCFLSLFLYLFLCLCSAIWPHNEAWEGIETNLRFSLFYAEYQTTKYSGWIFGQSLSDQHSETTPNSVCPIFWKSVCEFVLRTTQREHDLNLVAYLVYLRYLQVLLYLRGEWQGLPSRSTRFTLYSVILEELSTYRYSRLKISSYLFLVLDHFISFPTLEFILDDHTLNSWFSSYLLARRVYYLTFEIQTAQTCLCQVPVLYIVYGTSTDRSVLKHSNSFQNTRSANCPSDK